MWRPPSSRIGRPSYVRSVLFVTPWVDQGLGIQAREYVQWATDARWCAHVWALEARKSNQVATSEWNLPHVVQGATLDATACAAYCANEEITDVFVLEPTRAVMFDFARTLKTARLAVWAVPNLEMIRRTDLPLYGSAFTGVLCVNEHTRANLEYFKIRTPLHLWPFQLHDRPDAKAPLCDGVVRYLIVGGFNADRRKQAKKVMLAFSRAYRDRKDVHLTVLSQGGPDFAEIPRTFPNIHVVVKALTYEEVVQQYRQHHVVIMCSRAEGLGLPFYEAGRAGCAVISLNTAMFRELVQDNGWLIKSQTEPVPVGQAAIGNDEAIVHTYTFDPLHLAGLFQQLTPSVVAGAQVAARARYEKEVAEQNNLWSHNFPTTCAS